MTLDETIREIRARCFEDQLTAVINAAFDCGSYEHCGAPDDRDKYAKLLEVSTTAQGKLRASRNANLDALEIAVSALTAIRMVVPARSLANEALEKMAARLEQPK